VTARRVGPLLLLVVGLGLAAASGSRLGERTATARQATWTAEQAQGPGQHKAERYLEERGLPGPRVRLAQWWAVGGPGFVGGVLLILAGAVLGRRQVFAEARGDVEDVVRVDFAVALDQVEEALIALEPVLRELPMGDTADVVRDRLDELQVDVIAPVVDGRGQLMARHGVATFAEYFGPFSAGERNLNRVWSTLTDGHAEAARQALVEARSGFAEARRAWQQAEAAS